MIGETVSRALSYPYQPTSHAITINNDGTETRLTAPEETNIQASSHHHAVIACGSNRAPDQLRRKFQGQGLGPLHLSPATLPGHDCVYSAHITSYGSLPATLYESPGVEIEVAIVWLNDEQLQRMHETESLGQNYAFERLAAPGMTTMQGLEIPEAYHYRSLKGLFSPLSGPIALAEITARHRPRTAWSQFEALRHIYDLNDQQLDFEIFVYRLAQDPLFRAGVTAKLPKMF